MAATLRGAPPSRSGYSITASNGSKEDRPEREALIADSSLPGLGSKDHRARPCGLRTRSTPEGVCGGDSPHCDWAVVATPPAPRNCDMKPLSSLLTEAATL